MTPNADVVAKRLAAIADLLFDLESVGSVPPVTLESDRLLRHAVERILTQLVDLSVSINSHLAAGRGRVPQTYRQSFLAMAEIGAIPFDLAQALAPSAGLRNVLTHEYVDADMELVSRAIPAALVDYRQYVAAVARWMATQAEA